MQNPTIITPVNQSVSSKARIDYNEQIFRMMNNQQLMWDDGRCNPSKKSGGLFGFVHQVGKDARVEIH